MSMDTEILRLSGEFEKSWKSGVIPKISGFTERISAAAKSALLEQLVPVDLSYRLSRGEIPTAIDYAPSGPDAVDMARRALKKLQASRPQSAEASVPRGSEPHCQSPAPMPNFNGDWVNESTLVVSKEIALEQVQNQNDQDKVRCFGDYELLNEIARSGMGVVYKARQVNLNRVVALKMILAGQLASDNDVQRFQTEAEAAAHLDHPGIVPIYEIGQHEGQHFFSMGYVDGCSLADRVKGGPLPPIKAAEIVRKIADAIAYAHAHGVIHRDLKPANVLLDPNGEPKVTDFGLAKKVNDDGGLTRSGDIMGTPSYMPPEQAAGRQGEVGPLADVYSLGAILYCLLTGRPPFQAASPLETLLEVTRREPVRPTMLNSRVPEDLETICLKCLEKRRTDRLPSAEMLSQELLRFSRNEPIQSRSYTQWQRLQRWARRNPAETALILSIIVASVFLGLLIGLVSMSPAPSLRRGSASSSETGGLVMFCTMFSGPILTVIKWLGIDSVRRIEDFALRLFQLSIPTVSALLRLGVSALIANVVFLSMVFFRPMMELLVEDFPLILLLYYAITFLMTYRLQLEQHRRWLGRTLIASVVLIFLIVLRGAVENRAEPEGIEEFAITIGFAPSALVGGGVWVAAVVRLAWWAVSDPVAEIRRVIGFVPWPLSIAHKHYRFVDGWWIWNLLPLILLMAIFLFVIDVLLLVMLAPNWLAEQLRKIVAPQSVIFAEGFGWLMTICSTASLLSRDVLS